MANYFFSAKRCLIITGLYLAWLLPCAAQKPQPAPGAVPAERFCAPPSLGGSKGRGIGSGTGNATADDEVRVVFTRQEVTKKAEILFYPTPDFSGIEAGTEKREVKLRIVLCPKGYVSNISGLSKLPDRVTEKAVEAASNIRFIPAEKDGKRVAQYATVVYTLEVY